MNQKYISTLLLLLLTVVFPSLGFAENSDSKIGLMKNEHIIIESALIQVLPSSDDLNKGIITLRCAEEACKIDQIDYGPKTAVYNSKRQEISLASLITHTNKKASIWLKRGETEAEIIRIRQ